MNYKNPLPSPYDYEKLGAYAPPGFQYSRRLYTPPGRVECWQWSCKAELWSE